MQISWVGQSTKHHGATPIQDGIFIISIQVLRCPILYMFPLFIEISKIEHGVKITLATGYVRLWSCSRLPVQSVGNCSSVRTQFVGCGSPTSAAVLCSPLYFFFLRTLLIYLDKIYELCSFKLSNRSKVTWDMHCSGPPFHYQLTACVDFGIKILGSHFAVLPRLAPWDVSALPAPSGSGDPIQSHWWPGAGNYSSIPRKMRFKSEVDTDGMFVCLARQGWLVG